MFFKTWRRVLLTDNSNDIKCILLVLDIEQEYVIGSHNVKML